MQQQETATNRIGRDFTFLQLIQFALPAILTNLCQQLFRSLDDGLFVSRYVGEKALSSISLLGPMNSLIMAFAQVFSVGASTLSAQRMGNNEQAEAKRIFTRMIILGLSVGAVFALMFHIFCDPLCRFLGADDELIANSRIYVRLVLTDAPVNLIGAIFSSYYSTAGKPQMGLLCSIVNGSCNIIFDIILIAVMRLGVIGSSLSTVLGEVAVALIGLIFFSSKKHEIHFIKPQGRYLSTFRDTWKSGFSQFINSISFGVIGFVTNKTLLSVFGANGVAANTIINDLRTILNAAFVGYVTCIGPVIAYNYGSKNAKRLKRILSYNLYFWLFGTIAVTIIGQLLKGPLISIFFGENASKELYDMTYLGLTIEFCSCIFTCGCIFIMRMFVALGTPKTASILTVSRNFIVRMSMLLLLPAIFGSIGIWFAIPVAEFISFCIGAALVIANADNYGYGRSGLALRMQPELSVDEMKQLITESGSSED
jgi:putative MATE family efflux protein